MAEGYAREVAKVFLRLLTGWEATAALLIAYRPREVGHDHRKREERRPQVDVRGQALIYTLAMLPLLFMQLFYKTLWMFAVYLPLRAAGRSTDLTQPFLIAIVFDLLVIPWTYVFALLEEAGREMDIAIS